MLIVSKHKLSVNLGRYKHQTKTFTKIWSWLADDSYTTGFRYECSARWFKRPASRHFSKQHSRAIQWSIYEYVKYSWSVGSFNLQACRRLTRNFIMTYLGQIVQTLSHCYVSIYELPKIKSKLYVNILNKLLRWKFCEYVYIRCYKIFKIL